jgi:hypothetical protein
MILTKKNLILAILVGALIFLATPTNVFARIMQNGAGGGYGGADETNSLKGRTLGMVNTVEKYVIIGASFYLNAYSDILTFLNRVELSDLQGMDFYESRQILDRALNNMTDALKTYNRLIKKTEITPYNDIFIAKLLDFDYNGFMQEHGLNSVVFDKVEEYLKKGDITGLIKRMYTDFTIILGILNSIRDELYFERLPNMSEIWELNERCSKTLLLGQYASRIFYSVLNNKI